MGVQLVLLVCRACPACAEAEALWREVCERHGTALRVVSANQDAGLALASRLNLHGFPVLLLGGEPLATGVPDQAVAERLLRRHANDATLPRG